jgi:hypothetical protein
VRTRLNANRSPPPRTGAGEIFVAQPQNYLGESGACRTFIIFTETNSIPLQIKLAHFCPTDWRHFYR